MAEAYLNEIFPVLEAALVNWVMSNPKTNENITGKNARQLFRLDLHTGLTIDLTRFNEDYYFTAFAYVQGEKNQLLFVKKALLIIKDGLLRNGKATLKLNVMLKSRMRTTTKSYFIHEGFC